MAVSIKAVKVAVCEEFKISDHDFMTMSKSYKAIEPRYVASYISRRMTKFSLNAIGLHLGGYYGTTVGYAAKRISKRIEKEPQLAQIVAAIEERLMSHAVEN